MQWYGVRAKCTIVGSARAPELPRDHLEFQVTLSISTDHVHSILTTIGKPLNGGTCAAASHSISTGYFTGKVVNVLRSSRAVPNQREQSIIAKGQLSVWMHMCPMDPRWFEYGWEVFKAVRGKQLAAMGQRADLRSGV